MCAQWNLNYLDFQAYVGVSKHNGGLAATNELLSLCHIEDAREVLNVGCGIGVGSVYVAKRHGCRVVGVDILEKMIEWSRLRAQEEKFEEKVEFRVANVLDLPFDADRFDIVFCESVLAFVEDKPRAIRECVRVTRPGGYGAERDILDQGAIARDGGAGACFRRYGYSDCCSLAATVGGVWAEGPGGEALSN
jgi:ubiquinone/menaquinone biosynthesis C-methylase UbiE